MLRLPPHYRCASHTLSLLATTDFENVLLAHPKFKTSYRRAVAKLHALWNAAGRSVNASDDVFEILGRYLPRPVVTRWNSLFDSVLMFIRQDQSKIRELLSKLKIPEVTDDDYLFLTEFLQIMYPISSALDILQGETHCYLGSVLPLLVKVKYSLLLLAFPSHTASEFEDEDQASVSVRDAMVAKLDARFGELFKKDHYILAAVTHPKFKLSWLTDERERASAKRKLEIAIGKQPLPIMSPITENDFLSFDDRQPESRTELERYLTDKSKDLTMLDNYPTIKVLFQKHNTTLPSSAPVERLFSTGAIVLAARRARLSYALLEHLTLLKVNPNFV